MKHYTGNEVVDWYFYWDVYRVRSLPVCYSSSTSSFVLPPSVYSTVSCPVLLRSVILIILGKGSISCCCCHIFLLLASSFSPFHQPIHLPSVIRFNCLSISQAVGSQPGRILARILVATNRRSTDDYVKIEYLL